MFVTAKPSPSLFPFLFVAGFIDDDDNDDDDDDSHDNSNNLDLKLRMIFFFLIPIHFLH